METGGPISNKGERSTQKGEEQERLSIYFF